MLPNKLLGKYNWNWRGDAAIGAAWLFAALLLPLLVWTIFICARFAGMLPQGQIMPSMWLPAWLLFCLPCVLIAARCFDWRGFKLLFNIVFYVVLCAVLTFPAAMLIAVTIADWLH